MFQLNGKTITADGWFVGPDGTQYPGAWLRTSSAAEKAALGITEVDESARPDDRYNFVTDNGDGSYGSTPKALEPIREQVWNAIKAERDRRKDGGVKLVVDGATYWFYSDTESRVQYSLLDSKAARAQWPDSVVIHPSWKTMSGDKLPMTVARLRAVIDAGIPVESALFDAGEAHKAAIMASQDPLAYNYHEGWPQSYEDYVKTLEVAPA